MKRDHSLYQYFHWNSDILVQHLVDKNLYEIDIEFIDIQLKL